MSVGDIVPCPRWYHAEYCKAPGCQNEREASHADCEWCLGAKEMRVTVDTGGYVELEPLTK